jgi:hypothetical protein
MYPCASAEAVPSNLQKQFLGHPKELHTPIPELKWYIHYLLRKWYFGCPQQSHPTVLELNGTLYPKD